MSASRVVEENGAQVLPPSKDQRQTVTSWSAHCCADADQRTKSDMYAELAGRLFVEAVPA